MGRLGKDGRMDARTNEQKEEGKEGEEGDEGEGRKIRVQEAVRVTNLLHR